VDEKDLDARDAVGLIVGARFAKNMDLGWALVEGRRAFRVMSGGRWRETDECAGHNSKHHYCSKPPVNHMPDLPARHGLWNPGNGFEWRGSI